MKKRVLFSIILFIICTIPVYAYENKLYFQESNNKIYYDSSQVDKQSFMYHIDMLPGNIYVDQLIIENSTSKKYTLFFKIKSREQSENADKLLDNVYMKIYLDDKLIYDGKANGLNYTDESINLQDTIKLKEFNSNEKVVMKVETTLSKEYDDKDNSEYSYIDWSFYAQYGNSKPEEITEVPNTYDNFYTLITSMFICFLGLVFSIYIKRKINQ